jgi:putative membrane protein
LFGVSALEDQQLGGLVMWVPGGLPYLIAGLVIVTRWVLRSAPQERSRPRASEAASGG